MNRMSSKIKMLTIFLPSLLIMCVSYYVKYDGDHGFSDLWLGEDIVEITYIGPSRFNRTQAKKFALIRAAELLYHRGFEYLTIEEIELHEKKNIRHIEDGIEITHDRDSADNTRINVTEYPDYKEIRVQPGITIVCKGYTEKSENTLSIKNIIENAHNEDIINKKEILNQ